MREIKLLDPTVANQIAAGEVVTRPAAVVKELLENAVDASASNITLFLSGSGEAVISVTDDGCGIPPEQVPLAFARHATSKISSSQDIFKINTLGFRGEALASIASVAEVEMKTRIRESETGIKVLVRECNILSSEEVSMNSGTSISVYNLFYNTPARRKFLKSEAYEKKLCLEEFEHVALAHPAIGFTLQIEGQSPVVYPACSLHDRVHMMARKKVSDNLMHVMLDTDILKVEGWTASPLCQVQGTHDMYFFVNGRYMNPRLLYRAVIAAYGKLLPEGKSVPCYLFLEVAPDSIDVNVHPTKAEIKFDNEREIWDLIRTSVRKAVGTSYDVPLLDFNKKVNIDIPMYSQSSQSQKSSMPRSSSASLRDYNPFNTSFDFFDEKKVSVDTEAERLPFIEDLPSEFFMSQQKEDESPSTKQMQEENDTSNLYTESANLDLSDVIRLEGKYFAIRKGESLVIVNYARAQERIEFERFILRASSNQSNDTASDDSKESLSQRLLIPETIELSTLESATLLDNIQLLSDMGFEIGDLGSGVLALYSVPASMSSGGSYKQLMEDLSGEIRDDAKNDFSPLEKVAASIAKTYSVRRGIPTDMELRSIAESLFLCEEPRYTPVSQLPTMWVITTSEMDKSFKR